MRFRLTLSVVLGSLVVPATSAAQWDSTTALLLARADTGAALVRLRQEARATDSPESWCALAELLTSMATMQQASWRIRQEASEAFARGLRRETAECLYGYALLKEKQGTRLDAQRMLKRAERLVAADSAKATPAFRAAVLYRKALLLDDWLRNFDFLIQGPPTLGVSTPDCIEMGYFCENFVHPRFFKRAVSAPAEPGVGHCGSAADGGAVARLGAAVRSDPCRGELAATPAGTGGGPMG